MSRPLLLDDFDQVTPGSNTSSAQSETAGMGVSEAELESVRLQSYEKGYGAGWDDASKALTDEQGRISTEFARHLQELSFTYHEAHSALQEELSDLVRGLMSKVLAPASRATLGEMLQARIAEIAAEQSVPVEILVAPENVARLEQLIGQSHGPPLRLVPEDSLGEGQAFLRFGSCEEQIDLDSVMSELANAVERYFDTQDTDRLAQGNGSDPEEKMYG